MKKNLKLIPCYYWDGKNLIEYKKITYKDHLDYSERMYDLGFTIYYFRGAYFLFKNKCVNIW